MTVTELLTYTAGIMGVPYDTLSVYTDTIKLSKVNVVLQQCFNLENNNRLFLEEDELTDRPYLTSVSATVPYKDNIVLNVMPYGLAQLFALSDDDTIRAGFFGQLYADSMRSEGKFIASEITDYFDTGTV